MPAEYFAFGEILWDCLPSGRHAGGAPFNVAAHLAQLWGTSRLISSVGQDALGDELVRFAAEKGVQTGCITRSGVGLPTGTVEVTLDARANATYEIVHPVAWDEIAVSDEAVDAVAHAAAIVFGSLACRSPANRAQLERLLALDGPLKFFDVNLRPPFADLDLALDLARRAHVLKLNDDELGLLARHLQSDGAATDPRPDTPAEIAENCRILAASTNVRCLCVTRGANGATLWQDGEFFVAPAPEITVKDTIGAGDAFMAGMMTGLIRSAPPQQLLERACRLGAFVASQPGAIPRLPPDLVAEFMTYPCP